MPGAYGPTPRHPRCRSDRALGRSRRPLLAQRRLAGPPVARASPDAFLRLTARPRGRLFVPQPKETALNLQDLGWNEFFEDAFRPYEQDNLIPARVAARHHGPCELLTELGRLGGVPAGRLGEDELPSVGDWVAARPLDGERKAVIEAVLPRRTSFTRKEAWARTVAQVVAANVDTVFLATAFGSDLNPRRLERYLTSAWDSGSSPGILANQAEPADDAVFEVGEVAAVAIS